MGRLVVGIDIGGSTTKAAALQDGEVVGLTTTQSLEPIAAASGALGKLLSDLQRGLSDVKVIAATGVGARRIPECLLDLPVRRVDEFVAVGTGGLALTGRSEALVVSVGTGTALVAVYEGGKRIVHLGGTGVGGGTLQGLSRLLLRVQSIGTVEHLAEKGDASKVDLTVKDIAGQGVGRLPEYATASNFGKVSDDITDSDVAAGLYNLIGQVVGMVAVFASKACGLERSVVLVGRLAQSKCFQRSIYPVGSLFDVSFVVPENADFCAAIGASTWVRQVLG
ncbi:MAG: pantothenate kinase [Candidatus Bathyarchaeia archaeon]